MTLQREIKLNSSSGPSALVGIMAQLEMGGWDFKLHSRLRDGVRVYRATVWQHGVVWDMKDGAATPESALEEAWRKAKRKLAKALEQTKEGK